MQDNFNFLLPSPRRIPWNKGKLIGAKPPLRQKDVWTIRTKLQIDQRTRDLALFQSSHRQQATRLRCRRSEGRRRCAEWPLPGSGDRSAEKDRAAGQV